MENGKKKKVKRRKKEHGEIRNKTGKEKCKKEMQDRGGGAAKKEGRCGWRG